MNKKILLIAIAIIVLFFNSCKSDVSFGSKKERENDSAHVVNSTYADANRTDENDSMYTAPPGFLSKTNEIKITSYQVISRPDSFELIECSSWIPPTEKELPFIFSKLKPTNGYDVHDMFLEYQCYIDGSLIYEGIPYTF